MAPGDHPQVAPHFHLPLQSGSDGLLRRMNRQYTRTDYLHMLDAVHDAFDRPALTTDIIVGFPGETDTEFAHTLDIVSRAAFIDIHAFSYSPRPGTAAARWTRDFIRGPLINHRICRLKSLAAHHSLTYRQSFLGQHVDVLLENSPNPTQSQGRCERYFQVTFPTPHMQPGTLLRAKITRIEGEQTFSDIYE